MRIVQSSCVIGFSLRTMRKIVNALVNAKLQFSTPIFLSKLEIYNVELIWESLVICGATDAQKNMLVRLKHNQRNLENESKT